IMVLDTSALMENPKLLETATSKPTCFVVPLLVMEELDGLKLENNKQRSAQKAIKSIFKILSKHPTPSEKVYHYQNNFIIFDSFLSETIQDHITHTMGWSLENNDTKIVTLARQYKEYYPNNQVSVVSMDFNLLSKAILLRLNAVEYSNRDESVALEDNNELAPRTLDLQVGHWESLQTEKTLSLEIFPKDSLPAACEILTGRNPLETNNEEFLMVNAQRSHLQRLVDRKTQLFRQYGKDLIIKPKNTEQQLLLCALLDPEISLVIVHGPAGTGKTLLSLAAAIAQVQDSEEDVPKISSGNKGRNKSLALTEIANRANGKGHGYKNLLISRSPTPAARELGFMPGGLNEKMGPWMEAVKDNAAVIFPDKTWEEVVKEYSIIYGNLEHIRGRTIPGSFVIIDECQNLSRQLMRTIVTRIGESSKLVLLGDITQIDDPYLNIFNNGFSVLTQKIIETRLSPNAEDHPPPTAIISLTQCVRSRLATWSSNL
ncbi:MAG TPA: PhoH family protein, partial [bacterium]|nr:PhoH family protein [bacterium]